MEKAIYISEPCPACEFVKNEYLPRIEERFKLIRYDLHNEADRKSRDVELWSKVTNKIPTIILEGNRTTEYFIGIKGVKRLYDLCEGWDEDNIWDRKLAEPVSDNPRTIEPEIEHEPNVPDTGPLKVVGEELII